MIAIITTLPNKAISRKIGKGLLECNLIACYNLMPVESCYRWKDKMIDEKAIMMIIKTINKNFRKVEEYIRNNSGEEIPEIIQLNVDGVHAPYLEWLNSQVTK